MAVRVDISIKLCSFEDVVQFSNQARRERSIIEDSHHTQWFLANVAMIDPDAAPGQYAEMYSKAGCGALMILRGNEGRIKGTFVSPSFRGLGISKQLNDKCLMAAMLAHCSSVTAFVTVERNLKWYLQNGFRVLSKRGSIAFVKRIL